MRFGGRVWIERVEPIAVGELLPRFRLETIPREPFVLTQQLLRGS